MRASRLFRRGLLAFLVCVSSPTFANSSLSKEDERTYESAVAAFAKGAPTDAIQQFELLSDRGVLHPDISYDRAIAYVTRGRSPQAKPGDLGRAAFALSEALVLRPNDEQAQALLAQVDRELSRNRSRRGSPSLLARERMSRAIVSLLPENVWAAAALVMSLSVTVGLVLRFVAQGHRARLAGAIALALGVLLGSLSMAGLLFARNERLHTRQGVVVKAEARLLDATGAALQKGEAKGQDRIIPEGARVRVLERKAQFYHVEWGSLDAYVSPTELQLLPQVAAR